MSLATKARAKSRPGQTLVSGDSADTDIPVTGILAADDLVCVIEFATSTNDPTDRTSTCSITSDGNIQCTVDTSSDKLLVTWQSSADA